MNKILRYFSLCLMIFMGTLASGGAEIEEVIDFTQQEYENAEKVTSINATSATLTFAKGSSDTSPAYYNSGTAIRLYGVKNTVTGNTLTFTPAEGVTISQIDIHISKTSNDGFLHASIGTYDGTGTGDKTWTGTSTSDAPVTFQVGSTNKDKNPQVHIQSVTIHYEESAGSDSPKENVNISFETSSYTFVLGDEDIASFVGQTATTDPAGLPLTYSSNNEGVKVNENTGSAEIDPNFIGTATITASFAGNDDYNSGSASYDITVNDNRGTAERPYTVEEAVERIVSLGARSNVYVEGYISKIDSYDAEHNSITYWISKDGTTGEQQFEVYSGKGFNGDNFSAVTDLEVGSYVVINGDIKKYKTFYEFNYDNKIVEMKVPVTVTEVGVATYVTKNAMDFTNAPFDAYYVTKDGEVLKLNQVTTVPANTALLLHNVGTEQVKVVASADEISGTNLLKAGAGEAISYADVTPYYVLAQVDSRVGFFRANENVVPENKAYLDLTDMGAQSKGFVFNFDEGALEGSVVTAIDGLNAEQNAEPATCYNLAGQKVSKSYKGIVIENGKKVIK